MFATTVQRTHLTALAVARDKDLAVVLREGDPFWERALELSLRTLDRDVTLADRHVHSRRNSDRCLAYS
jgi:hypothetical protein